MRSGWLGIIWHSSVGKATHCVAGIVVRLHDEGVGRSHSAVQQILLDDHGVLTITEGQVTRRGWDRGDSSSYVNDGRICCVLTSGILRAEEG